jgi:hypothetical protein
MHEDQSTRIGEPSALIVITNPAFVLAPQALNCPVGGGSRHARGVTERAKVERDPHACGDQLTVQAGGLDEGDHHVSLRAATHTQPRVGQDCGFYVI